ncbi:M48 family metalloprotease [Candidatus Acetothermia bacterium]|nr:M48 family metalloprotease [Candidatus Acetothermia bacterium]MBI3644078.1 M48 family metalloprotease [Candidatus Acetothermia bacterium]
MKDRIRLSRGPILVVLLLILSATIGMTGWGARAPIIVKIIFPGHLGLNETGYGKITYADLDNGLLYARLDVADGRFQRTLIPATHSETSGEGVLSFSLQCTSFSQQITLAATLFDASGARSAPQQLVVTCGEPPLYNFDTELARVRPVEERIPIRFFILDDRQTTLVDGAAMDGQSSLGKPRTETVQAIKSGVIPSLGAVWDQCGLGFDFAGAWVVNPASIKINGGTLANALINKQSGLQIVERSRSAGDALREAAKILATKVSQGLPDSTQPVINVFVIGSKIMTGDPEELNAFVEGFGENTWPNDYILVRWGSLLQNVAPKQMIATLSHEIGHTLGLAHVGEDGLADVVSDMNNLMRGSGVSPQPRASLSASQCTLARKNYAKLADQLSTLTASASDPGQPTSPPGGSGEAAKPSLKWVTTCPQWVCVGMSKLSISAEGFDGLGTFGFASFMYSANGDHYVEIGLDRNYTDGFGTTWDTRKIPNGLYFLKVTVTDAKGTQASLQVEILVQNL